ncbi:ABC transporter permease [Candidatus Latescibacterota bacterium]
MLKTLIKKELLEHLISLRFLVLIVICLTLIPLSFFVSYKDYENRLSDYNQSVQLHRENLANIQTVELFTAGFSVMGYLPPSPLTVFALGVSDGMPQMFEVSKSGTTFGKSGTPDATILTLAGKIDFMFIVQIVFSLLAILFTFDAVCGEKEKGTLKASLANSIPRDTYILGKFLGTMIVILIPFLVSFLAGLLLLILLGFPVPGVEMPVRIISMIIGSIVFISVFSCIGLFISSRASSSKTSMIYLISLWILTIILVPKGSDIIAKAVSPIRSQEVVQLEKTMLRHNIELEKGTVMEGIKKNLPQLDYNEMGTENFNRISEQRNNALNPIRDEYNTKIADGIARIEQEYSLEKDRQFSIALALARISPVTSFNKIMTDLAWTGETTKEKFKESALAHQDVLDYVLFNKIFHDINPDGTVEMGMSGEINLKELPQFVYNRSTLAETFASIGLDIGLLLFFLMFTFVLVYVSFLRYDIR